MSGHLIGYARVSTREQELDLQISALEKAGCDRIFTDRASGATTARPELDAALSHLREGDTLVVWRLDRLGRSLAHLIEVVVQLGNDGVAFRSLQESMDTETAGGKFIFSVFGAMAEFERELIRERTQAGLAAARARGRVGGRKPVMNVKQREQAQRLLDEGKSASEIGELFGVSRATVYRHVERRGKGGAAPEDTDDGS